MREVNSTAEIGVLAWSTAERPMTEPAPVAHSPRVPARVYAVMALTTATTFATLTTGYQLLFPHNLFA